jgi:hypothetical protein
MQRSYAEFDRAWGLGCAGLALGLVALLLVVYSNPIQRARLRFYPPGMAVPVSELRPSGPPYSGRPLSDVAASTSLDVLRQTVLGNRPCPYPPSAAQVRCWADVHVASGLLLIAAVPTGCGNRREWYGWTSGSALMIDLATWGCIPLGYRDDARPEATYALLGVPLSRLPHGRLLVYVVDSVVPPVAVTVP